MKRFFLISVMFSFFVGLPVDASEAIDAVWKKQEIEFSYVSTEVAYSCDLMEARVKMLLKHLGATNDVSVKMPPCMGSNRPQRRFRMTASFSTLASAVEGDAEILKAEWRDVEIKKNKPRALNNSDCELVEMFTKKLLPSIEHQVVEGKVGCGATKHVMLGTLKLKVLSPISDEMVANP